MTQGVATDAAAAVLGMSPMWIATGILLAVYGVIMTDRVNRAILALLGAGALIFVGVLTQDEALRAVDFNTLGLLLGMMLIVNVTRRSGVFEYVAIWSAKKVHAAPWGVLLMMCVVTAVFSAFLDNVTTVLLTVPVTLHITTALKVKPYPFLFAQIFASNIGGTATLIGDPPNIMIGSAANLTFNDFGEHLTPVIIVVFVATMIPFYLTWGRKMKATEQDRQRVMAFHENEAITDPRLLKQSLSVIALVIAGFMLQRQIQIEPATIAVFGAAVLLLLDNFGRPAEEQSKHVHAALSEAEWITLMFFLGLFVVVHGVVKTGLIDILAQQHAAGDRRRFRRHRGRDPLVVGVPLRAHRQHSVRRDDDPADQGDGAGVRRRRRADAALVGAVARRLPRRQRNADRRIGEPRRRGACGARRHHVPVRRIPEARVSADGALDRDLQRLRRACATSKGTPWERSSNSPHPTASARPPTAPIRRDRRAGGIVVAQEIFGVNRHIRAVCDGFAADGYVAVAPALFDRMRARRRHGLRRSRHRPRPRVEGALGARSGARRHRGGARCREGRGQGRA